MLSREAAEQMLKRSRSQSVFVSMISQQTLIPDLRIKAAAMMPFCASEISEDSSCKAEILDPESLHFSKRN